MPEKKIKGSLYRPKAQGEVEVELCPFFSLGARRDGVASLTARPLYPMRDPVRLAKEAEGKPEWTMIILKS
jgi:hypothetical protein